MGLNRVGIVSSAQTQLRAAWSSAQHIDLISAVVSSVFKGTGLGLPDVDFVIDAGSDVLDGRSISNCGFLGALGAHHKEESRVEEDGLWAAVYGATKIASGAASVGLIVAYSKPSETSVDLFYASQCEPFYQRPVGFDHRAASGIQAQRYMAQHGVSQQQLAALVTRRWSDAAATGLVEVEQMPTEADVLASPNAARPLTEMMMSRPVDGAVAVLLATEDIARRMAGTPVWITGMGSSMDGHAFSSRKAGELESCAAAGRRALDRAGWSSARSPIVEVSGSSAVGELMVLESLGIAPAGRGLDTLQDGTIAVNTSGGALPADPIMATGLVRLGEAYRQLAQPARYGRGAPAAALVHGAGGVGMQSHCVVTLEV